MSKANSGTSTATLFAVVLCLCCGTTAAAEDSQTLKALGDFVENHWLAEVRAQGLGAGFLTNRSNGQLKEAQAKAIARLVEASKGRRTPEFFADLMRLSPAGNASTNWSLVPEMFEEPDKWFARAWPVTVRPFGRKDDPKTVAVALGRVDRRERREVPVLDQKVPLEVVWLQPGHPGGYYGFLGTGTGVLTLVEPGLAAGSPQMLREWWAAQAKLRQRLGDFFTEDGVVAEVRGLAHIRTNAPSRGETVAALLLLRAYKTTGEMELGTAFLTGLGRSLALQTLDMNSPDHRLALDLFDPDVPAEFMMKLRGTLLAASESKTPHLFLAYLVILAEENRQFNRIPRTWDHARTLLHRLAWYAAFVRPDLAADPLPGVADQSWAVLAKLARLAPEDLCNLLRPFCREILAGSLLDGVIDGLGEKKQLTNEYIDRMARVPVNYGVTNVLEIKCKVGEIYWQAKRWDVSAAVFQEMARMLADGTPIRSQKEAGWVSNGFVRLAMQSVGKKQNPEALSLYRKATEVDLTNALAALGYGEQLFVKKDYEGAIKACERALDLEQKGEKRAIIIKDAKDILDVAREVLANREQRKN